MARRPPRRQHHRDVHGVLLLDKPQGMTSNQVLQRVKYLMEAHKAGHTGSLDPLATGLLPICFGEASKVSSYLLDADKHYDTVARLGVVTDSGDATGEVIQTCEAKMPTRDELERVLDTFRGKITQTPPMHSALQKDGKRLYELARKGIEVDIPSREVTISRLELMDIGESSLSLSVSCSKGTYIRSLVRDIGEALGCGAHVEVLRRTGVDPFTTPEMITFEEVKARAEDGTLEDCLLPVDKALVNMPSVEISEERSTRLKNGLRVHFGSDEKPATGVVRVYDDSGHFIGIGECDGMQLKARRLMSTAT